MAAIGELLFDEEKPLEEEGPEVEIDITIFGLNPDDDPTASLELAVAELAEETSWLVIVGSPLEIARLVPLAWRLGSRGMRDMPRHDRARYPVRLGGEAYSTCKPPRVRTIWRRRLSLFS